MSPSVLRAVVVDSDAEMRAAIRRVLSAVPAVAVVGEYRTAGEAALGAPPGRPDIAIVEVSGAATPGEPRTSG